MKYVKLIFRSKVLNYERHLTYFQFLICRKIIESSLEHLNHICVTKLTQEQAKKNSSMKTIFSINCKGFSIYHLDSGCWCILGLIHDSFVKNYESL